VEREGVGAGGEMTQALYAQMNNKTIKKKEETGGSRGT
jgi:NaMN:DMB phosphoribosyltransferase